MSDNQIMTVEVSHLDQNTGRIMGKWVLPVSTLDLLPPGLTYPEVLDGAVWYVDMDTMTPVERPNMPLTVTKTNILANGVDTVMISGIPFGTRMTSPLGDAVVEDGVVEFTTTIPGEYAIHLSLFPYLDNKVVIYAT